MSRRRVDQVTLALIALGFGTAVVLALRVQPEAVNPLLGDPMDSGKYVRELKTLGGEANVLSAEFQDWFAGLWHGAELPWTVMVLTVIVTFAFRRWNRS